MISQQSIQQVLSHIDIVDIIGAFVKLKKRGSNYLGLCPFHTEKTPSFTVSPSKEIYKCFGCGRSGNAIGFIMEHEKYSYVETLQWLAQKYQITLEETEVSPELREQQQLAESLFIINNFARDYFSETLFQTEEGRNIGLTYLEERKFSQDLIRKFQLGYCPEGQDGFSRAALAKGYKLEYLQKAGLTILRQDQPRDNYHGRVIFPVHNQSGKVIGFGARVLGHQDRAPKYINTPENEIYNKGRILYGTYFARQAIGELDECLLVEGYTDVLSLHQAGICHVVASGGTSLTHDQLRLIRKYTVNLTILYDGDSAGINAALRGLELALEEGLHVRLVLIPDQEDPDSYVRKIGPQAFREFIEANKKDIILFQMDLAIREAGQDPRSKAELVNRMAETISRINKAEDFTLRQDYIRKCSQMLRVEENGLVTLVNKYIRERIEKRSFAPTREPEPDLAGKEEQFPEDPETAGLLQGDLLQEKGLLKILIKFGQAPFDQTRSIAQFIFDESVELDMIDHPLIKIILLDYKKKMSDQLPLDKNTFLYHESQEIARFVAEVLTLQSDEELSPNWEKKLDNSVPTEQDIPSLQAVHTVNHLQLHKIKRMIRENQSEDLKPAGEEEIRDMMQIHQRLKEMERKIVAHNGSVILG